MKKNQKPIHDETEPSHAARLLRTMGSVVASLAHPTKYTLIDKTGKTIGHFTVEELEQRSKRQNTPKENTL